MTDIIDFDKDQPHELYELICVKCYYRYLEVAPLRITFMSKEFCPSCKEKGGLIRTGQPLDNHFVGPIKGISSNIIQFPVAAKKEDTP